MLNKLSIREWQRRFKNGEYNAPDFSTQVEAGWYDWFCQDESLARKTQTFSKPILKLKDSKRINLDTMYVWFKNNCPVAHGLYDDFRIADISSGEVLYTIVHNDPYDEDKHLWNAFAICEDRVKNKEGRLTHKSYQFKKTKDLVDWLNEI